MKALETVVKKINNFFFFISCLLVLALIAVICMDVIARYVFNSPIGWVYEMSYIFGAFIAATGIAHLMMENGNIRVDMFYARFSEKVKAAVDVVFAVLLFIPAYTALTAAVIRNLITAYNTGETSVITTWYPKVWPIKLVICIGLVMMLVNYILITIQKILRLAETLKRKEGKENA